MVIIFFTATKQRTSSPAATPKNTCPKVVVNNGIMKSLFINKNSRQRIIGIEPTMMAVDLPEAVEALSSCLSFIFSLIEFAIPSKIDERLPKQASVRTTIYILKEDEVDKNDLIAYQESAIYDLTSINLKRKADVVMLYICDHADDGAVSLSKMITPLGRKEQIKIANAVVEVSSSRCYFLGNKATKCQQLIANYVMNVEVPIKDEFKGKEQLPFQAELEEHMKEFNIKDFKAGTFYAH